MSKYRLTKRADGYICDKTNQKFIYAIEQSWDEDYGEDDDNWFILKRFIELKDAQDYFNVNCRKYDGVVEVLDEYEDIPKEKSE